MEKIITKIVIIGLMWWGVLIVFFAFGDPYADNIIELYKSYGTIRWPLLIMNGAGFVFGLVLSFLIGSARLDKWRDLPPKRKSIVIMHIALIIILLIFINGLNV